MPSPNMIELSQAAEHMGMPATRFSNLVLRADVLPKGIMRTDGKTAAGRRVRVFNEGRLLTWMKNNAGRVVGLQHGSAFAENVRNGWKCVGCEEVFEEISSLVAHTRRCEALGNGKAAAKAAKTRKAGAKKSKGAKKPSAGKKKPAKAAEARTLSITQRELVEAVRIAVHTVGEDVTETKLGKAIFSALESRKLFCCAVAAQRALEDKAYKKFYLSEECRYCAYCGAKLTK